LKRLVRFARPLAVLVPLLAAAASAAGQVAVEQVRTADGRMMDLPENGGWRVRAREVAVLRAALRMQGDFTRLNAAAATGGPAPAPAALAGAIYLPAVRFGFSDTDTTSLPSGARYDSLYFGLVPPTGRSYSLRTLYREMSNDLFDVQGSVLGWVLGDSAAAYYLGACGSGGPTDCTTGEARVYALFRAALTSLDPATDFGLFDNDGPDGVPNSGDDDGFVDAVQFVQPVIGGECGGPGIWAHRYYLSGLSGGSTYVTDDARPGGGFVQVNSYFVGSGVGGAGAGNRAGCGSATQLAGIGTMAHEFGHVLGLPDLYDVSGVTEGIGEWGLMGSAGYTSANSPGQFDAWSKAELGWVSVVPATVNAGYGLGPVVSQDTVVLVAPPPGIANPRGEYFLLENRQAQGSDTANMLIGGNTGPKNGGLLVWHIDSTKVASGWAFNQVNAGSIHGVALVQADGLRELDLASGGDRGDAGDPYPGSLGRTSFSNTSMPAAIKNADGQFVGFTLDSIRQVTPGAEMAFRLAFGVPLLVTSTGPGSVSSSPAVSADTALPLGAVITLAAVPDADGLFERWSGDTTTTNDTLVLTMTRPYTVSAEFVVALVAATPSSGNAVMGANFTLPLTASGGTGSYGWLLAGGTLPAGVTLKGSGVISGIPEETGSFTATARVMSGTQTKDVPVSISVSAPALTTSAVLGALLGTGASLTADEVRYLDLVGNRNGRYDVGDFHAFIATTGGAVSAEMMADVLRQGGAR